MRKPPLFFSLILAGIYLYCLAPTVHVHDAGELTAASWALGIGHPPGGPLYMMLQKLFLTLVPFGHIAWRANLFSLMMALVCFFLLDALAYRRSGNQWLSSVSALAFCLSVTFWSQAEMAEVYTLQTALLLLIFLNWKTPVAAFLWGLLLTCHMGLSPVTPLILVLLAWPQPYSFRLLTKNIFLLLPYLFLPLLVYFYLPLRSLQNPDLDWGNPENLQNFWWHFTNRMVRGKMLSLPWPAYADRAIDYAGIILRNVLFLLPWSVAGFAIGIRKRIPLLYISVLILAADAVFVVLMDVAPLQSEAYAIPSVLALFVMSLLAFPLERIPSYIYAGCTAVSVIVSLVFFSPTNDLHANFLIRDAAETLLGQTPEDAVLFTQEDNTTFPLAYLTAVEGARPDLTIYDRQGNLFLTPFDRPLFLVGAKGLANYRKEKEDRLVNQSLKEGKTVVYSSQFIDFAPTGWFLVPAGASAMATQHPDTQSTVGDALPFRIPEKIDWMSRQVLAYQKLSYANSLPASTEKARVKALLSEAQANADMAPLAMQIAQTAWKQDHREIALEAARKANKLDPWLAAGWHLTGKLLFLSSNYVEAEKALQRAVELDSTDPNAWNTLGLVAVQQKNWQTALNDFTRSLELVENQPDALYNRFLVLLQLQKLPEATNDLCKFAGLIPADRLEELRFKSLLIKAAALKCPECIRLWIADSSQHQILTDAYLSACRQVSAQVQENSLANQDR